MSLAEIESEDFPGERLICCRNPLVAAERASKREDMLRATERALSGIERRVEQGTLSGRDQIGLAAGAVWNRFRMGKHFELEITDERFGFHRKHEQGVVDLRSQAAVARQAAGTHLRRVRAVARRRPDQEADHDGLAGRERACGQNPIALAVGRAAQLDALLLGNLGAARLALREDRRSAATPRGGAGRPGRMNVGQGKPFR